MAAGYGLERRAVMRNRYVIVGPRADPADVHTMANPIDALAAIAQQRLLFVSRGDQSGTHKAELRLWQALGVDPGRDYLGQSWYRESGSGQGATLNIAVNLHAYCLTDEATWATFNNQGNLTVLFDHDAPLMDNFYSIILVNPQRFAAIDHAKASIFADWLTSEDGQRAISSFKVDGKTLFRSSGRDQLAG